MRTSDPLIHELLERIIRKPVCPTRCSSFHNRSNPKQKTLGTQFGKFDETGEIGKSYAPFIPGGKGPLQEDMHLNLPLQRFENRQALLNSFDDACRKFDSLGDLGGLSGLQSQAIDMISKGVTDAFDLSKEDPRTIAKVRYQRILRSQTMAVRWQ